MDGTEKRNPWEMGTVTEIRRETARAKTFRFALPKPSDHLAGQHYIIRLTAPDGYVAQRSYSVASAPDGTNEIELTVERLEGGEVSMFLHDEVVVGDQLELRGPIGRWFVWDGNTPAVLVGGGSGVVPLMAMLRLARKLGRSQLVRLVVSVRTPGELYYHDELPGPRARSSTPGPLLQGPNGHRATSPGPTWHRPSSPRRRGTFAARRGSQMRPATCSSTWACRPARSGSSVLGRAVERLAPSGCRRARSFS